MSNSISFDKVSVHGGHSGSFCDHAVDTLPQVVNAYVDAGYKWVCLTEHMPPASQALLMPEELENGHTPGSLMDRFAQYFEQARQLQQEYANDIEILVGFETEAYTGYQPEVASLIERFQPDMIVGSVHHVQDVLFDADESYYNRARQLCGSLEDMYCKYFDRQLELINRFEPAVVGHFDLIRIYDPDYKSKWEVASIRERALRNLARIKELGLILDLNTRAFKKGAAEPYVSAPWLDYAIAHDIPMALGDDSHGVANVGTFLTESVEVLIAAGGQPTWTKPHVGRHVCS